MNIWLAEGQMKKFIILIIVAAIFILALSGCNPSSNSTPEAIPETKETASIESIFNSGKTANSNFNPETEDAATPEEYTPSENNSSIPTQEETPYKEPEETLKVLKSDNNIFDPQKNYPKELKPAVKYYQQQEYGKAFEELNKILNDNSICFPIKSYANSLICLLPIKYLGKLEESISGKLIYIGPYQGSGAFQTLRVKTSAGKIQEVTTSAGRMRIEKNIKLGEKIIIQKYQDDFLLIKS